MGDELILYKNKIWRPYMTFNHTGTIEEFTLDPSTYLFIANGGCGGKTQNPFISYGGTTYGIIDLNHQQKMYAVVGGNGEDPHNLNDMSDIDENIKHALGGYNGGGKGGLSCDPNTYVNGAGGGGATDVRLSNDTQYISKYKTYQIADEYQEVEYIQNSGTQYIDTGWFVDYSKTFEIHSVIKPTVLGNRYAILSNWQQDNDISMSYEITVDDRSRFYINASNQYTTTGRFNNTDFSNVTITKTRGTNPTFSMKINSYEPVIQTYSNITAKATTSAFLFVDRNQRFSTFAHPLQIKSIMIKEDDVTIHYFLPCYRKSDNDVGMFDIITNTYHPNLGTGVFTCGDDVISPTIYTEEKRVCKGLLSRIIVAGGGGGTSNNYNNNSSQDFMSFGGGPTSGYPTAYNGTALDNNVSMSASQITGYAFGYGSDAEDRVSGTPGAYGAFGQAGGGGGWFGGYALTNLTSPTRTYSSGGGGGGSSYILTPTSYRPEYYLEDYQDIISTLYFRDTLMLPYQAFNGPSLTIYKESSAILRDDTLIIPYTGNEQSFDLIPGKYNIKCYGGDGATRYQSNNCGKGGYAEGVLTVADDLTLYSYVGSSSTIVGIPGTSAIHDAIFDNHMVFQAAVGNYNTYRNSAQAGGGSVDLRLIHDDGDNHSDSLLSRIIVAGGGGGQGADNYYGGDGGGSSGASYVGNGYGTNNGPGTQTSTPSQSNANGGFGYGGIGINANNGYGGSGGYGWFGGNGTIPDGSGDDDKGGCGGSGYVLTESSFKPTGYIPDETFWMTDTVLTTGGNTTRGLTRIEITALEITAVYIIAYDEESYKTFNINTNEWESIPISELTDEVFDEYGVLISKVTSDVGLLSHYKFFISNKFGLDIDKISAYVSPLLQHVTFTEYTTADVLDDTFDYDTNDDINVNMSYEVKGIAENKRINIDISFDMLNPTSYSPTVYVVQFQIRNKPTSYYYPQPLEKHIDDLDLLYVGNKLDVQSRYKKHIGSLMPDGTSAITDVLCSSSCEYKRNIYTASLINNSVIRFTRFNMIENKSYIIRDGIPKNTVDLSNNSYTGGSLLVDENNMYLFNSNQNNSNYPITILKVPLDSSKPYTTYTTPTWDTKYTVNGYGEAYWLTDNLIVIMSGSGFVTFNTTTSNFAFASSEDNSFGERNDITVGDYTIICHNYSESATIPRRYDKSFVYYSDPIDYYPESGIKVSCYNDGLFYITSKGHLYILEDKPDHELTLKQSLLTPYSTLTPKSISCSNGILYVTCADSSTLFIYDINNNTWVSTLLPFSVGVYSKNNWYRPTVFKGFFFIGNLKLYVTNFNTYSKYRVGQKSSIILIQTNDSRNDYVYDDAFVTINDTGIKFHMGYIDKQITLYNEGIYQTEYFDKDTEYKSVVKYEFKTEVSIDEPE